MHQSIFNQFSRCFPEMISEIKCNALVPLVKLFLKELESRGFTFQEIVFALGSIAHDRGLKREVEVLDEMLRKGESLMFRGIFYFLSDTLKVLHQLTFTLAALPKEGEMITVDNLSDPHQRGLIGKVQKVALMLDAASSQDIQNDFVVLATVLDYVEEDVITIFIQSK